MRPPYIALDIDEVVCDLHRPWLVWLRNIWGEDAPTSFTEWDFDKRLVPVSGIKPKDFLCERAYRTPRMLPVLFGAPKAVHDLRVKGGFRIMWTTSCINDTEAAKLHWLKYNRLWRNGDVYIPTYTKEIAFGLGADWLVDDYPRNTARWPGPSVLINAPHNGDAPDRLRSDSLLDAIDHIL